MNAEKKRFLAHALELEADAMGRYEELADALSEHNNPEAAEFFADMALESAKHLKEVEEAIGGAELPVIAAWDFDWAGDAPESADYEALHYRMSAEAALRLALANERAAQRFYAEYATSCPDSETASMAQTFADEEAEHAQLLEARLATLAPAPDHQREDDDPPHMPE